jgi:prepilin peptidase CpaA
MSALLPLITPVALLLLAFAALHDIAVRWLPNWLSLVIFVLGLILRVASDEWAWSLSAAAAVFVFCVFAWRFGLLGGGDVKLLAAITTLVPAVDVPTLLASIALAGGILALLFIALRAILPAPPPVRNPGTRPLPLRILRVEAWRVRRGGPLPYAVAIAAGTTWVAFGCGVVL